MPVRTTSSTKASCSAVRLMLRVGIRALPSRSHNIVRLVIFANGIALRTLLAKVRKFPRRHLRPRADVLDHFGGGEMHARHLAPVSFFRSSLIRDCQPSPWP